MSPHRVVDRGRCATSPQPCVDTVDPATGRKIRPPLISMRATRDKFDELVLTEPRFDPVASIK